MLSISRRKEIAMKYKLCLVALTLALGLFIAQPAAVLAADTQTEEVDKQGPNSRRDDGYQAALDQWNKLTEKQKQEVYTILKTKQKADMDLLSKLSELGVLEKSEATAMQSGLQKIYNDMMEKGEFPLMRPHRNN